MIFVDTGAWFAAFVPNDPDHEAADRWLAQNREPLVTTDYVIDELMTLMRIRGEYTRALSLGESLISAEIAHLEWVTPEDIRDAWEVYRSWQDKEWSFTDCVSRAVMERVGVQTAFAFDDHFRQFGTVVLVP